jgi:hypothetical protein
MKHDTRRIRSSDVDAVQSREGSEGRYARRGCLGRASGGVQRSGCVRLAACVRTEEMVVKAPWCEADTPVWVEIEIMSAPRRRGAAAPHRSSRLRLHERQMAAAAVVTARPARAN